MVNVVKIAEAVAGKGGRAFYVGGYVRDRLLGLECKDVDMEVYGLSLEELHSVLMPFGRVDDVGRQYGVFHLVDSGIDVAVPRTERCVGAGHKDFEVTPDPFLTPDIACRRRDFTINAMLMDVLSGEVVDPYGGMEDIKFRKIRHVAAESFVEDPLRVLRACQFAARFGYEIDYETMSLCRAMDISTLQGPRVEAEMKKALLLSSTPSIFFEYLRKMNHLSCWFPELHELIGVGQNPKYHPEGDVWIHTMQVLDRAARMRDRSANPYEFMMLALTHDLGKSVTTTCNDGVYHSYRHESEGVSVVLPLISRLGLDKKMSRYLSNMILLHMSFTLELSDKTYNKVFDKAEFPEDLILFSVVDKRFSEPEASERISFLNEKYTHYKEVMSRPYVSGSDLIDAGISPSPEFSRFMDLAHDLRLAEVDREQALKQVLAMKKQESAK